MNRVVSYFYLFSTDVWLKSTLVLLTHFIPLQSSELNKSIFDASDALSSIPETRASENKLRGTVKVTWSSFAHVHHEVDPYYAYCFILIAEIRQKMLQACGPAWVCHLLR